MHSKNEHVTKYRASNYRVFAKRRSVHIYNSYRKIGCALKVDTFVYFHV